VKNIRKVDFKYPEEVLQTTLTSCKINGQEIGEKGQNWSDLLIAITEWFIAQNNPQLALLESMPFYRNKMFFLPENHATRSLHQLSNGKWICIEYTPSVIVKIIGNLCQHCGLDLANVVITYERENELRKVRSVNDKRQVSARPRGVDLMGNVVYYKDDKKQIRHRKPEDNESQTPVKPTEATLERENKQSKNIVDFKHPENVAQAYLTSCKIRGQHISLKRPSWQGLLVAVTEWCIAQNFPQLASLESKSLSGGIKFFLKQKHESRSSRQLTNGKWLCINYMPPVIIKLIGNLFAHCGVDLADIEISYEHIQNPKNRLKSGRSSEVVSDGKVADKKVRKERQKTRQAGRNERSTSVDFPKITRFQPILDILRLDYVEGFRFDYSYVHALSSKVDISLDDKHTTLLKKQLYQRSDNFYFILDNVADADTRKQIAEYSEELLKKYGYFELSVLYSKFASSLNLKCIRNIEDFQMLYTQKISPDAYIVTVPKTNEQIVCKSKDNVYAVFDAVAQEINSTTFLEEGSTIREDTLHKKFPAFSKELLAHIIKNIKGSPLLRCIINGFVSYKSQVKNNIPSDFSDTLAKTLHTFDQLGLPASEEALHTALSQALGFNFMGHFGIPSQKHFKRLISTYYKADTPRRWKNNIFERVAQHN